MQNQDQKTTLEELEAQMAELEAKKAALEEQAQAGKEEREARERAQASLDSKTKQANKYLAQTERYAKLLKAQNQIVTIEYETQEVEVKVNVSDPEGKNSWDEITIDTLAAQVTLAKIKYRGQAIKVDLHMTGSYSSRSGTWKMRWDSKWYKNPKTVLARIDEYLEAHKRELDAKAAKAAAVEAAVEYFKALHPDAEVEAFKDYRYRSQTTYQKVKISLPNGCSATYAIFTGESDLGDFAFAFSEYHDSRAEGLRKDPAGLLTYLKG